jgi:hypothetical protein
MECPPTLRIVGDWEIARRDDTGASGTQTCEARVRPGSSLVQVGMVVYWKPSTNGAAAPASGCEWTLYEGVTGAGGSDINLKQAVFTSRNVPDGWELVTTADVLFLSMSLAMPSDTDGAWRLRVMAGCTAFFPAERREELLAAVRVDPPSVPLRLAYP